MRLITLKVYDILGNEIITLIDKELSAGEYEITFSAIGGSASGGDASELSRGVYFYHLKASSFIVTKKMVLIR